MLHSSYTERAKKKAKLDKDSQKHKRKSAKNGPEAKRRKGAEDVDAAGHQEEAEQLEGRRQRKPSSR